MEAPPHLSALEYSRAVVVWQHVPSTRTVRTHPLVSSPSRRAAFEQEGCHETRQLLLSIKICESCRTGESKVIAPEAAATRRSRRRARMNGSANETRAQLTRSTSASRSSIEGASLGQGTRAKAGRRMPRRKRLLRTGLHEISHRPADKTVIRKTKFSLPGACFTCAFGLKEAGGRTLARIRASPGSFRGRRARVSRNTETVPRS